MTIDDKTLQEIERLEKLATPGPWEYNHYRVLAGVGIKCVTHVCTTGNSKGTRTERTKTDAELIALVRTQLPALLSRVRAAEETGKP